MLIGLGTKSGKNKYRDQNGKSAKYRDQKCIYAFNVRMHDSFEDDQVNTLLRFKAKVKIDFELLYSLYKEFKLVGYSECS